MGGGGVPRARSQPDRLRGGSDPVRDEGPGATADTERAQFLAAVSHEMRTPLTSIISFSELLRGEAAGLTQEGLHFLGIIERNADRLLRLIDDLLMLNRLEAGGLPLELTEVSLPDLAAEAVKSVTPVAAKSGVTVHLDAGEGPRILADPRRLTQVLDNLIGNAVKFSHVDGLVRVRVRYLRGSWRIDVADTGIGIPADEAARLFGPFVRGSNARRAGLPGTGLGLAIVKSLVEMHGGHVKVESALDEGTTFSVFLPVRTTVPVPTDGRCLWKPRDREVMVSDRVLVIEDDPDIALGVRTVLGRSGFEVTTAAEGREGLRAFHSDRPDIVVLDVGLPAMDGWTVLERIRELSEVPVLMLTSHGQEADKVRGLRNGADDYVTKPFGNAEFVARVQALLRRRHASAPRPDAFDDGRVRVDFVTHQVLVDGAAVELTPIEFRLLGALVRHRGEVLSSVKLLELAWSDPSGIGPDRVKYSVMRLRRKLGTPAAGDSPIEAVRGFGYRYRARPA